MNPPSRRPSQVGALLSAGVVVLAGFGIAVVEALQMPKASIWVVVVGAVVLIGGIRALTRPRRGA